MQSLLWRDKLEKSRVKMRKFMKEQVRTIAYTVEEDLEQVEGRINWFYAFRNVNLLKTIIEGNVEGMRCKEMHFS